MTEPPVHVHVVSMAEGLAPGRSPARSKSCEVTPSMRTFIVGVDPVPILGQVSRKRRAQLFTYGTKVVITGEPGEASAAVGTAGGNGIQLPDTTNAGPIELFTTSDIYAISSDGTPQVVAVLSEFWSE